MYKCRGYTRTRESGLVGRVLGAGLLLCLCVSGAARSDVRVWRDVDTLYLLDGTKISCTILFAGQAAVTILTSKGEQSIPRSSVQRMVKGEHADTPEPFKTEKADGFERIVMPEEEEASRPAPGEPKDKRAPPAPTKAKRPAPAKPLEARSTVPAPTSATHRDERPTGPSTRVAPPAATATSKSQNRPAKVTAKDLMTKIQEGGADSVMDMIKNNPDFFKDIDFSK